MFIINFEYVLYIIALFLLLTWNRYLLARINALYGMSLER